MNTRAEFLAGGENGEIVVPGNASASMMIELIESTDDYDWMPPKGPRVPPEKIAMLKKWIDAGLPWEPGIRLGESAWEPPLRPRGVELPAAQEGREHPIDRILDADLKKRGKALPPPASDAAFVRRATLDAIGLVPTPESLEAFLINAEPDKKAKYVESLLANDVGYADHWLTTWNDLLRNDYTGTGFITKGRTQITTWLYAALRENRPFDEFVRELIAPSSEDSAGFINGIQWRGDVNASQTREIQFSQNISQVFLGINMKCASCHDSFIDRWTLSEAYNLAAIFSDEPLELNRCDKPIGVMATPRWIFPELGDIDPEGTKEERLQQLADLMTHSENGRFTRTVVNRIWERLMGRGIVHPVDAMDTKPWNEDLLDYLAVRFAEDGYDLRTFIRFVMTSQAYQSQSVILEKEPGDDYAYAGPIAKRMTAEQFLDTIWQITESHPAKAEVNVNRVMKREGPGIDGLKPANITAKWIWHEGPTGKTSRLRTTINLDAVPERAVLMATCDNAFAMKINGSPVAKSKVWTEPVYQEITKSLKLGENVIEVDAEMFGGGAGFIAQISIFASGAEPMAIVTNRNWEAQLADGTWAPAKEIGKHGTQPWGEILDPHAALLPASETPPVRAALVKNDFLMRSLGRPHRDQVVTTRPNELTTLQAIDLANGDILAGYLTVGAKTLLSRSKQDGFVDWLYHYALSRGPTPNEKAVLDEVVAEDLVAVEDLLWLVFMQPEFQIIR